MDLIENWVDRVRSNWRSANSDSSFRKYFWLNFGLCLSVHYSVVFWIKINSTRPGTVLDDMVYHFLSPNDFSFITFFLTYSAVFLFLFYIAQHPFLLQRGLSAFVTLFLIRGMCIYLVPLSPAPGIIPLRDPITNAMAGEGTIFNDLFFSGHIGDLSLFFLICQNKKVKAYILFAAITVGLLLIWQRVHYTVDVIAAPFFSYFSYWIYVKRDLIWGPYVKKHLVL